MKKNLSSVPRESRKRTQEAEKEKREKAKGKPKTSTHVFRAWKEAIRVKYGKPNIQIMKWNISDRRLANLLLENFGYDTVEEMINRYVETQWHGPGLPVFYFFWLRRESLLAMVNGQIPTGRELLNVDEYDEERDGKQSKVGWD